MVYNVFKGEEGSFMKLRKMGKLAILAAATTALVTSLVYDKKKQEKVKAEE